LIELVSSHYGVLGLEYRDSLVIDIVECGRKTVFIYVPYTCVGYNIICLVVMYLSLLIKAWLNHESLLWWKFLLARVSENDIMRLIYVLCL
jgi:hypothetical protein